LLDINARGGNEDVAEIKQEQKLLVAIKTAREGNKERARELLNDVLSKDPENELAWIWLAAVVEKNDQRRYAFQKALEVNPANTEVQNALNSLVGILDKDNRISYDRMSAKARVSFADETIKRRFAQMFDLKEEKPKRRITIGNPYVFALNIGILMIGTVILILLIADVGVDDVQRQFETSNVDVEFVRMVNYENVLAAQQAAQRATRPGSQQPDVDPDGNPEQEIIVVATAEPLPEDVTLWLIQVTIRDADAERDNFASGWDVVLPNERVAQPIGGDDSQFTREILFPYDDQPFTLSQIVPLPNDINTITVRAYDSNAGFGGQEVTVTFDPEGTSVQAGNNYEVVP